MSQGRLQKLLSDEDVAELRAGRASGPQRTYHRFPHWVKTSSRKATKHTLSRSDSSVALLPRRDGEDPLAKMKRVMDEVHLILGLDTFGDVFDYMSS